MVMAQSLFITLKNFYPDCVIDVVSPEWSLPLLQRMPEIRKGIGLPVQHGEFSLSTRIKTGVSLRSNNYTHAIVIPRSWKSALVPYFSKVPIRTGYRGEMRYGLLNDIRPLDKRVLEQTVQRYVAHAYDVKSTSPPDIPYPRLWVDEENRDKVLSRLGLGLEKPVIAFMPGAEYGPAKQWPLEYYAELASLLLDKGYQVWVMGSSKDESAGSHIVNGLTGSVFNLCGKTSLTDVIDLLSGVDQVVTNDSGLMHVAAAVGVKVNAIYGSSTPEYTPPLADNNKVKINYLKLECSPCFERECPLGHTQCLRNILPMDVLSRMV